MGAKGWLDRMFRGEAVSDAAYSQPEIEEEEQAEEPALDGTYARSPQSARSPRRDNVVEFPRASAGTGSFARDTSGTTREPSGFPRESSSGFTKEFREGGGSGSGSGFGGGGFSGGGSYKTPNPADSAEAYVVFKLLKDFTMATAVADRMTEGKIVILNLENCDDEIARRVLDFIGGVAYACSGMVKRIAGRVFIITPKGVSSDGEFFDEIRSAEPDIRYDD